jgi:hypothetical protein
MEQWFTLIRAAADLLDLAAALTTLTTATADRRQARRQTQPHRQDRNRWTARPGLDDRQRRRLTPRLVRRRPSHPIAGLHNADQPPSPRLTDPAATAARPEANRCRALLAQS